MDHQHETKANIERETVYAILKYVPVAIYHVDLVNRRLLMVNEYMCRHSGYTEEELLSFNPLDFLSPQSRALFVERLLAMEKGEPVSNNVELEFIRKNGEPGWARLHIHHIYEENRITSAYVVADVITDLKKNQQLREIQQMELERLVGERTSELAKTNKKLRMEIEQRAAATEKLRAYSKRLEEMNTAMRVLLDKRSEDRQRSEQLIRMSLKELLDPYLERLENSDLRGPQRQLVDVIRTNLEEVIGSTTPAFSSKFYMFSPNELQVVNLIRTGKTTKEMAQLLNLSTRTIEAYRNSIRKKLNLKGKKINLRTYLSSM